MDMEYIWGRDLFYKSSTIHYSLLLFTTPGGIKNVKLDFEEKWGGEGVMGVWKGEIPKSND